MAVGLSENDLMNDLFEQKKKIPDVWLIPKKELEGIQNDILNNQTYNFIVTGSAGSGKTVLATYKFMELVALYGCDEVTLVVYTLSLMEFIKCGLENTIKTYKDETFKNVNIDKLNIFNAGNKKLSDKISEGSFNYILIDETQDMTEEFIKNISLNIKNFMFFGDDEQTLYKNRISMERLKSIINKKD
ncbi:UvrD-helicase domain-containing protein [Clostridium beijerinckii]|uniref:UvrD-helicase domain-containing protein n=1 Tax=Clostridium beijerinckii TaxID=1520 RepID=UPI0015C890ED|nr:UvrD-helicase domain-containing protein [Clostridium beijerinckii]NYC05619.1 superfamily I DNA and RNA helicase [Clostridium beijerinckii]